MELSNEMLNKMFQTFNNLQNATDYQYALKNEYYKNNHDILSTYNLLKGDSRSNEIIISNYIQKFVDLESAYVASNPINFTSGTEDTDHVKVLYNYQKGFSKNSYLELLKQAGIFGEAYKLLYYIKDGDNYILKSKIYTPLNSFIIKNDFDEIEYFLYIYSKNFFDDQKYIDLYTKDTITTYKVVKIDTKTIKTPKYVLYNFELVEQKENLFGEVPISICNVDKTIFDKIKRLNDNLNISLSNNINISNDFRTSYMAIKGAKLKEEDKDRINKSGVIYIPSDGDVKWISRDVNSEFAINLIKECIDQIYQQTGHINSQEKTTSNTSGSNLRNRLIQLEQRCGVLSNSLTDAIKNEIRLIYKFDNIFYNSNYNYLDVNIKTTMNVPVDMQVLGDFISKVGDRFPLTVLYALCPFIDNPQLTFEKYIEEKRLLNKLDAEDMIDLDNIEDDRPSSNLTEEKSSVVGVENDD